MCEREDKVREWNSERDIKIEKVKKERRNWVRQEKIKKRYQEKVNKSTKIKNKDY